jgi:hypothetical protein
MSSSSTPANIFLSLRVKSGKELSASYCSTELRCVRTWPTCSNSSTPKRLGTNRYKLERLAAAYKFCYDVPGTADNRRASILITFPL